jgi:hypothetical protein
LVHVITAHLTPQKHAQNTRNQEHSKRPPRQDERTRERESATAWPTSICSEKPAHVEMLRSLAIA